MTTTIDIKRCLLWPQLWDVSMCYFHKILTNWEQEAQVHNSSDNGPFRDLDQLTNINRMCRPLSHPEFLRR